MNIQRDIQTFLQSSGWNQAQLARAAGIHPIIISRVLRDKRKGVHSSTLSKLWPFLYGAKKPKSGPEGP